MSAFVYSDYATDYAAVFISFISAILPTDGGAYNAAHKPTICDPNNTTELAAFNATNTTTNIVSKFPAYWSTNNATNTTTNIIS